MILADEAVQQINVDHLLARVSVKGRINAAKIKL